MKNLFKRLPLPAKLMLIGILPLIFLIFLSVKVINQKNERIKIINQVLQEVDATVDAIKLADNIHLERRYSLTYLLEGGNKQDVLNQRALTDRSIRNLDLKMGKAFEGYASATLLDGLAKIREEVLSKRISPEEMMNYYSSILLRLHSVNNTSFDNIPYLAVVNKELVGQRLVSQMANYLGMIRADLYHSLLDRHASLEARYQLENHFNLLNSYWNEFQLKSTSQSVDRLKKTAGSPDGKFVLSIIQQSITSSASVSADPEEWLNRSATIIDELKDIQAGLVAKVAEEAKVISEQESRDKNQTIAWLVVLIVVVIFIVLYTIRDIAAALAEIRMASERLARGETGLVLTAHTHDAVGALTRSILEIDKANHKLAHAASEIGKGNFLAEFAPRGEDDLLGMAVMQMKQDLQQYRKESQNKIWIQTGLATVNKCLQGEQTLEDLARGTLGTLVKYLEASVGLFYLSHDNCLEYFAGYAVSEPETVPSLIRFGETLVGQAAADKESLFLDSVPDDFLKVASGTGSTRPNYVAIIPLLVNGEVQGVVEIASLQSLTEVKSLLLRESASSIAVAVHAARSRARLQELFEETQAQAEELQSQHSELENMNTELEAQTQKLQASEEELKVQQEELLQANQELEERTRLLEEKNGIIVERNLEIQKKAEELQASSKYKSEFLANMSHELRTPLNSILLLSRLMKENREGNLSNEQMEYAQVIQSSGNGLLALIDEILDLSKIEAGKMELAYEDLAIRDVVDELQGLFAPLAKEKNLELRFEVDPSVPSVISTDKLRLGQVLKNLLSNSLKFTSRGSVKLGISLPADRANFISFAVKDSGIGIAPDKQQLVFEAFQQADGSTRRKYGGTGLGLSISREIVRLLGGEIELSSQQGVGSEFIVTIPMSRIPSDPAPAISPATPPQAGHLTADTEINDLADRGATPASEIPQKRFIVPVIPEAVPDDRESIETDEKPILIVEDDTSFAKTLLAFTRKKGYKGIVAVSGDEGVELARQFLPQAILLDIKLPVKDGWEVMEELKSSKQTRHIPVHIMSSEEARKESLLKGAIDFISKPVALDQLQAVFSRIESALNSESRKVLIVEENAKHAKALAYFLDSFAISSEIANSVNDGVDALQKKGVDCVILDMGVPDQTAYQTLEALKRDPEFEKLPIIVFTGKSLSKSEEIRLKQYADTIVMKTAHSYQRILDEVAIFLHLVEEKKSDVPGQGQRGRLGGVHEVLTGKTVLVADDDVRNIFSLTKALEQLKMKVVSATDGKDALQTLEEHPEVDLILMDMMMPEMDGYETTSRIRSIPKYRDLPILAVTAKAMMGDREKCIAAGASDYISKPIDIDQLISLLRVWLYDRGL